MLRENEEEREMGWIKDLHTLANQISPHLRTYLPYEETRRAPCATKYNNCWRIPGPGWEIPREEEDQHGNVDDEIGLNLESK